jgi:hypothetical protein
MRSREWDERLVGEASRNYRTYCETYRTVADVIGITASGQSRHFDGWSTTSVLPQ